MKSLGGEALAGAALVAGRCLAGDRRYALLPGAPGAPRPEAGWRPKSRCIALFRHASAARLAARYDDARGLLSLSAGGREIARGVPEIADDRARLEAAAAGMLRADAPGGVDLVAAGAHGDGTEGAMTDVDGPYVSLVNLGSVAALEEALDAPVDALRFRANFHVEGVPAWAERDWVGRVLKAGGARLEIVEPIERCAAIEVNPASAMRDLRALRGLADRFGHVEMGVYARVVAGGPVAPGLALGWA
ncbi:MAG: MOSC domain-containing protein [Candidatus Odyssella sp.]|nr:MOSC domain-containing protein [Candidatus Odyssella sp.]